MVLGSTVEKRETFRPC